MVLEVEARHERLSQGVHSSRGNIHSVAASVAASGPPCHAMQQLR